MEAKIFLGGKVYTLKDTFEALSNIEKELAASITSLAVKLAESALTLEGLATIVANCLDPKMPEEFVRSALLSNRFSQATQAVARMFSLVFNGAALEGDYKPAMRRKELEQMNTQFPD